MTRTDRCGELLGGQVSVPPCGAMRAFRRKTRKDPHLRQRILHVLEMLTKDPFDPSLKTHKLRGKLEGLWACWVQFDCRIVFAFEPDPSSDHDIIVLIDLGTHDEVY